MSSKVDNSGISQLIQELEQEAQQLGPDNPLAQELMNLVNQLQQAESSGGLNSSGSGSPDSGSSGSGSGASGYSGGSNSSQNPLVKLADQLLTDAGKLASSNTGSSGSSGDLIQQMIQEAERILDSGQSQAA